MSKAKEIILGHSLRADKLDEAELATTFVNVGSLVPSLNSINNSILFGRRGTGKTHVFKYIESIVEAKNDCCIYIDMRIIGSTNSIYSDEKIPIEQRVLSFLSDVIKVIHDELIKYVIKDENKDEYMMEVTPLIDKLVIETDSKEIAGDIYKETLTKNVGTDEFSAGIKVSTEPSFDISLSNSEEHEHSTVVKRQGAVQRHVNFTSLAYILREICEKLNPHKIWILIDEYSELNQQCQIYLSDMFKRVLVPQKNLTFKIASIEHRSRFIARNDEGMIGLELGADVSAFNLDDFMVFGNNEGAALTFFRELLFNHINYGLDANNKFKNSNELISEIFTQEAAFQELVRASEGVARDCFNILAEAVRNDFNNKVSIPNIRKAAKTWYNQDKQKSIEVYPEALEFLNYIIEEVLKERHARAFLVRTGTTNRIINYLYDARILHLLKRGISSKDTPGIKYDVYSIDYGCYCDLINTASAPKGLFEAENDEGLEEYQAVPKDDYRSIRRAILDMKKYEEYIKKMQTKA